MVIPVMYTQNGERFLTVFLFSENVDEMCSGNRFVW